jgi:inner membrane protein involved in colicin E2 resistance
MRSWGGRQPIGGPILVVPYKIVRVDPYGDRFEKDGDAYFLPEVLSIDVGLLAEPRSDYVPNARHRLVSVGQHRGRAPG